MGSRGRASGRPSQRAKLPLAAASETPAPRTARNTRPPQRAKTPSVPKRHPQMAQPPRQCRKAAVPTPTRVADGGLFDPPTVGRGILDAPKPHPIRGRQGCRPLRRWWSTVRHCGGRAFRAVRGATRGAASGLRDLGNAPPVGKRCRRGILCQSKAQLCSHTGCMARSWAAAMAQKARRHPQTYRR